MKHIFTKVFKTSLILVFCLLASATIKAALPVITVTGDNPYYQQVNTPYVDLGATAVDENSNIITQLIQTDVSQVVTTTFGTYFVTYTVSDAYGNIGTAQRTVIVTDKIPPVISSAPGSEKITVCVNDLSFSEPQVTATDNYFSTVNLQHNGSFNIYVIGTYIITYNATDAVGNSSTYTRTITVVPCQKPNILCSPHTIEIGGSFDPYTEVSVWDAYYTPSDFINNTNGCKIDIISSNLDLTTPGIYQICYQATNGAGLQSDPHCCFVSVKSKLAGINAANAESNITIYPNPNNGSFKITTTNKLDETSQINIIDVTGKVIYKLTPADFAVGVAQITLNVIDAGVYFIQINNNQGRTTQKFIVTQ
jgi:hypothetical protein